MGVVGRWGIYVAICAAVLFALLTADSPAAAQSALLDTLSTHVTLARDGAVDLVTDERVIRSGDTVATDRTGHAVVTYPDGSTALLEESSELTIEFVHTTAGDYVVRMQQTLGRVWYAVARTIASGSRYEVHIAAMASVIRAGSSSFVAVLPGGETTVVATAGSVETSAGETSAGGTAITVPAGASAVMSAAGSPSPPGPAATVTTVNPPATPSLAAPREDVQTALASPTATERESTPSAAPTAFAPPADTLPPPPVVITMAKVARAAAPLVTPTQTSSPTTSTPSADPTPQTTAAGASSAPKASQSASTASVKLAASTAPAVEPKAAPKPAAAPERVAAARAAAPEPVTAAPGRDSKAEKA